MRAAALACFNDCGVWCRDVAHARSLLTALFQTTCKLNDEVQRTKAEITDLEEKYEIEKGTAEAAKEEAEERRAELDEARAAANAAETSAEEASRMVSVTEAARKQVRPPLPSCRLSSIDDAGVWPLCCGLKHGAARRCCER